jgi:uncharacterized protein YyaL (SSP411 family)
VLEAMLDGPREVAIIGPGHDPRTETLRGVALRSVAPGLVVAVGEPGGRDGGPELLQDRPLVAGAPTAYVCRGFVCALPTTDPHELARQLASDGAAQGANDEPHPAS